MPAMHDERQLVRKDRGGYSDWKVSADEQQAVTNKLLIRRDLPWGEVVWFHIRGRDATVDDLVDAHGCLAFETGVFLGLCGCLFKDVVEQFRKPQTTPVEHFTRCEQILELLQPKTPATRLRSDNWYAVEPKLKLATDLISKTFPYSAAFEPSEANHFFSSIYPWPRKKLALETCYSLLHRMALLIKRPYLPAASLGILSVLQRWKHFEVVRCSTMPNRMVREFEACCPRAHDGLQSLSSSRQCVAAVSFLQALQTSDYLTFSESLAKLGGEAWAEPIGSVWENHLFQNTHVPVGSQFGTYPGTKRAGRPPVKVGMKLLMKEFHDKHPYITSDFRKALLREFEGPGFSVDTDDVQNFFRKRAKPNIDDTNDPKGADQLLPSSSSLIKHILRLCQSMPGYGGLSTKKKSALVGLLRELGPRKASEAATVCLDTAGTSDLSARDSGMNRLLAEIHSECWPGFRILPNGHYLVPKISSISGVIPR